MGDTIRDVPDETHGESKDWVDRNHTLTTYGT